VLADSSIEEIETLLLALGGGNHVDNMRVLNAFPQYLLVELSEAEFFDLVFLQNDDVLPICPRGQDRRLRAVALRAQNAAGSRLHDNWDLREIVSRSARELQRRPLRPLLLRDTNAIESQHGVWYIQDGCHSALGYGVSVLFGGRVYDPVRAYCATRGNTI
jgi:hypothetical protein